MREAKTVVIPDGTKVLTFRITPMNALRAEAWMYRAAIAIGGSVDGSMLNREKLSNAEAVLGMLRRIDYEKAEPLLAELLTGVEHIGESGASTAVSQSTVSGLVEYPTTLALLRAAVLKVNFGFFGNGGFNTFLENLNGVTTSVA